MKHFIYTIVIVGLSFFNSAGAQITKGSWMFGGSGSFSENTITTGFGGSNKFINYEIIGRVGYFFIDKLAGGLKPNYSFGSTSSATQNLKYQNGDIGPFVRYFLLDVEKNFNFFVEANYNFGFTKTSYQPGNGYNTYRFSAGPTLFLNSTVALDVIFTYGRTTTNNSIQSIDKFFKTEIGLQFYLQKG
jgi:hypothetical protein